MVILKKIFFVFIASIMFPLYGNADTIFLKDGRKIEADKVWEENGQVKYRSYGAVVGYPKERVEKIERSGDDQEHSFKFDIWTFGMTVRQVFDIAEINDLPLRRADIISINDHFRPSERDYADTVTELYYRGDLLGKSALVSMFFTPITKRLHTISIKWGEPNARKSDFRSEIESIVCRKYGKPEGHWKELFSDNVFWLIDGKNTIIMKNRSTQIELIYIEKTIETIALQEAESIKQGKRKEARIKDGDKF